MNLTSARAFKQASIISFAVLMAACASPARIEQMQVDTPVGLRANIANPKLKENVAVKDVTGGSETNPLWKSNVGSTEFERALENSLRSAGFLAAIRQGGLYQLVVFFQKLDQPMFGASLTVTATVQYTLVERATGKNVFTQTISTPYTAAFGDALLATERLKLANEGAARLNIQKLIEALVQFKP